MTKLSMWTIYDHPSDYPGDFVARRFVVDGPIPRITDDVMTSKSLHVLRCEMMARGLTALTRMTDDDPKIVEVWL